MWKPPWYGKLEEALLPAQGVVVLGLMVIAALCVYFAFQKSATLRTLFFVYLISP